jgi:hypothetical protein
MWSTTNNRRQSDIAFARERQVGAPQSPPKRSAHHPASGHHALDCLQAHMALLWAYHGQPVAYVFVRNTRRKRPTRGRCACTWVSAVPPRQNQWTIGDQLRVGLVMVRPICSYIFVTCGMKAKTDLTYNSSNLPTALSKPTQTRPSFAKLETILLFRLVGLTSQPGLSQNGAN